MVTLLSDIFSRFRPFQILVLGDFMLDAYTTGRVRRISPEAPVPVMEVLKHESRPGGAGNAALNLAALEGRVYVLGRVGADSSGKLLQETLASSSIDISMLLVEPGYPTPVKNRLIADSQQLLRIDTETIIPVSSQIEEMAIEQLHKILPRMQVVAISDYGKGFLSNRLLQETFQLARKLNIPTIVDPKGIDFSKYKGAVLIKPNLSEAYAAANLPSNAMLDAVAAKILEKTEAGTLLITRSEAGMSLFDSKGSRQDFPVYSKEVKDVTGAGDTVLAVMGLSIANGLDMASAVKLSNIAAGIAIERVGCIQVRLSEIAQRLLESERRTKIFEESHTYALQHMMAAQNYRLLVIEPNRAGIGNLYRMVQKLCFSDTSDLVVYLQDSHPDEDFVHLLSSMQNIQTIILQKQNLKHFCTALFPKEVFYIEGSQIKEGKERLSSWMASSITAPPKQCAPL